MIREIRDLFYSAIPRKSYLKAGVGTTNILITAPHGGGVKPVYIQNRKWGRARMDTYTRRASNYIMDMMRHQGYAPYFVVADIHRSKVDLNRDIEEAAQGNKYAESIWKEWHKTISMFKGDISAIYGNGLHIELHSYSGGDGFHIGYGLSTDSYIDLSEGKTIDEKSTIDDVVGKWLVRKAIFGSKSIGETLMDNGFDVVFPTSDGSYYNGGYNIRTYGSDGLASIQIEIPVGVIREQFRVVCEALFRGIRNFRNEYIPETQY